jgi:ATP-dependent protease ClpP protease subunit
MPIQFQCNTNSATLTLSGGLDQALVLDMRDKLRLASDYYKHDHVEIVINSPGGEALALKALAAEMQWLQSRGCTVSTTAMMEAGSASALVLALGDVGHRTVQPYSSLVFHNTRIIRSGEHALTAIDATTTARRLEYFDEHLVAMLVNHLQRAHGGLQSFAKVGLQRCQTLQREASLVVHELGSEASINADLAYERVLTSNSEKAFAGLLADFFAMDKRMPVEMAWALQLIDAVEGISVLQPELSGPKMPLSEATNSPAMRLAA